MAANAEAVEKAEQAAAATAAALTAAVAVAANSAAVRQMSDDANGHVEQARGVATTAAEQAIGALSQVLDAAQLQEMEEAAALWADQAFWDAAADEYNIDPELAQLAYGVVA